MPRRIVPLTEQQIVQAEAGAKPRKLFDGYGLYLDISPNGKKAWRMKYRHSDGRENRLTFGDYPEVSLSLARCRRAVARQMLQDGLDPRTEFNFANLKPPRKVEPPKKRVRTDGVKRLHAMILPLMCHVTVDEKLRVETLAILQRLEKERSDEVIDLLCDLCAHVMFNCLALGIEDLIESKFAQHATSARVSVI